MLRETAHANPVYRAEQLHQQRSRSPRALNILSALTLVAVLALFTTEQDTGRDSLIVLLAVVAIHLLHFITSFLAVSFAYESIYREYRNRSWDLLRITLLARGKLIEGKLRAIVDWLVPLYGRVIGLKALFMFWQITQIYNKAHITIRRVGPDSQFQDDQFLMISAVALLFVIAYLLLDLLYTTALGMAVALLIRAQWRRIGLAAALLVRWWLPLLTLAALITCETQGVDPLPTQWNTHLSLAARYLWGYGFGSVGYSGAVDDVFPSLTITIPDGPLMVFMHTTATWDVDTVGHYFSILLRSLFGYLGLALGMLTVGWAAARLRYK